MIENQLHDEVERLTELVNAGSTFIIDTSTIIRTDEAEIPWILDKFKTYTPPGVRIELRDEKYRGKYDTAFQEPIEYEPSWRKQVTTASGVLTIEDKIINYQLQPYSSASGGTTTLTMVVPGQDSRTLNCSSHTSRKDFDVAVFWVGKGWPILTDDLGKLREDLLKNGAEIFTTVHLLLWGAKTGFIDPKIAPKIFQKSLLKYYRKDCPYIEDSFEKVLKIE